MEQYNFTSIDIEIIQKILIKIFLFSHENNTLLHCQGNKMTDFKLIHGIYESVINHALEERLSRLEENYTVTKNQFDSEAWQ